MSKKYEKLHVGAAKALKDAGYVWTSSGSWYRDVYQDSTWKAVREEAELERKRAITSESQHLKFVTAIMKLLGVYAKFPYQAREDDWTTSAPLKAFEADVFKAARDFEAERALRRIRKAVRENLLKGDD